jgi:CheY-like chemotaxis protein
MTESRTFDILIIDDNPGDADLVRVGFDACGMSPRVMAAGSAEQAIKVLQQFLDNPALPQPELAVLDLNMPRVSGFAVLEFIQRNPPLRGIPVLVVSGSNSPDDRRRALDLGAIEYVVKPTFFEDQIALIERLKPLLDGDA